jgi:hypothetical protein
MQGDHLEGRRPNAVDPLPGKNPPPTVRRRFRRPLVVFCGAGGSFAIGLFLLATAGLSGGRQAVRPADRQAHSSGVSGSVPASVPASVLAAVSVPASATSPTTDLQQQRFAAAVSLVKSKPGHLGIVVRDRQTGTVWRAGDTQYPTWTSSTIKLAIATSVLERGRSGKITVDAAARGQIEAMLNTSDNDAADALWDRYGRDALVPRFQTEYGMSGLTFVAGFPRYWGFMKSTAEDLQRLMSYVLDRLDPADREVVVDAMRHVAPIQQWGVWAAGPAQRPGTKDGWSIETDDRVRHWCTSTVGFAGPNERYTVAAMYSVPPGGTIGAGVHALSDVVATVFGARLPALVTVPDPETGR